MRYALLRVKRTTCHVVLSVLAGDVVLVLKEKPHPTFQRTGTSTQLHNCPVLSSLLAPGNDLVHTATISLSAALTGTTVTVTHLDKRVLSIPINEVVR